MPEPRPPFRKVLVANRGEIALRVIRACRDLGIPSVAVYSEIDHAAPHVRYADEAYSIGPAPAAESYLRIDRILDVAQRAGADAIHPGYGFLSENAEFVRACRQAGIVFIGPSDAAMTKMGSKIEARRTLAAAGVPVIPGTIDPVRDPVEAARISREVGYPVLIKAAAGGGGKGIREAGNDDELERAITNAQQEARAAFGDDAVYIEKLIRPVRHIEIQVIADHHGNIVTLGERECSLQRRRQKLIEECPSPVMTPGLLARMREAARKVVQACDYTNAGTVECLVYGEEQFAFLEMNARLQVEHPVTELVWTVDLVVDQIRVAAGERLGYGEEDVEIHGWAIECRIAAEDPYNQFLPSSGTVYHYREPAGPGVRVESGLYSGMPVSVHYDPMLAKIVTWGVDREQARRRMLRALSEFRVVGVQTNVPFHVAMLQSSAFRQGAFHTLYVEQEFSFGAETRPDHSDLAALAAAAYLGRNGGTSAGTPALSPQRGGWAAARGPRRAPEQGWQRRSR